MGLDLLFYGPFTASKLLRSVASPSISATALHKGSGRMRRSQDKIIYFAEVSIKSKFQFCSRITTKGPAKSFGSVTGAIFRMSTCRPAFFTSCLSAYACNVVRLAIK